ncbi:MAG: class I SAM-dependent methyltransferase [Anaerolineae bacterium]|nr:class I SAM-dependent methyltransferase [Anaerolineae bacterium]
MDESSQPRHAVGFRVTEGTSPDDLLWQHLRELPAFRALLRAVEARFYCDLPLDKRPILDVGCGDGHFTSLAIPGGVEAGFDPWQSPLREAAQRQCCRQLSNADGKHMPYAGDTFGTVISNSVLEHIPDVQPVLNETFRVLKPGGTFYFCVPGPDFVRYLSIGRLLDRLGLRSFGDSYRRFFNRLSRHYHCDGVSVWRQRLETAGLTLEDWWAYFTPGALAALEWGHYLGLPSWLCRKLTGRWILVPGRFNLLVTERLTRRFYNDSLRSVGAEGAYLFFVARKRSH